MAARVDITAFSKGEDFQIEVTANNRDRTPIDNAATQTFEFIISSEAGAVALLTFNTTPQIVLADADTGLWQISLSPVDLTTLTELTDYWYEIWTTSAGGIEIHHIKGILNLNTSKKSLI